MMMDSWGLVCVSQQQTETKGLDSTFFSWKKKKKSWEDLAKKKLSIDVLKLEMQWRFGQKENFDRCIKIKMAMEQVKFLSSRKTYLAGILWERKSRERKRIETDFKDLRKRRECSSIKT